METPTNGDALAEDEATRGTEPWVSLDACEIGNSGALARARCARIRMLHLETNLVGDAGAIALAKLPVLGEINLSFNLITDVGAVALARSTSLRALYLAGNRIGDVGAAALARNAMLYLLCLNGNQIGDAGARALGQPATLRILYLGNNLLSDTGVAEFAKSLEAGNACALSEAELCCVKRAIGQHAFGEMRRYVGAGNRSLHDVHLGSAFTSGLPSIRRVQDALQERRRWGYKV